MMDVIILVIIVLPRARRLLLSVLKKLVVLIHIGMVLVAVAVNITMDRVEVVVTHIAICSIEKKIKNHHINYGYKREM